MIFHNLPEITSGVLLSRLGEVHKNRGRITECGTTIPARHVPVSHVQAVAHKLRLCRSCYPHHHGPGGSHAHR